MLELRAEYLEYREGHLMDDYNPQASVWGKLTGTTPLTAQTAVVIKQTYLLFGLSVFMAIVGGYIGATSDRAPSVAVSADMTVSIHFG